MLNMAQLFLAAALLLLYYTVLRMLKLAQLFLAEDAFFAQV